MGIRSVDVIAVLEPSCACGGDDGSELSDLAGFSACLVDFAHSDVCSKQRDR